MKKRAYTQKEIEGFVKAYGDFRQVLLETTGRNDELRLYQGDLILDVPDYLRLLKGIGMYERIPKNFRESTLLPDPNKLRKECRKIKINRNN